MADEKIKEVISNLEREITEQMTALNVCRQKIREITVHLEKQSKQLKSLNESLDAQLKAPEVKNPPESASAWHTEPVQIYPAARELSQDAQSRSRITPPAPGQAGKTIQELDATGEAPTTRLDMLSPEQERAGFVSHAFRQAHPKWTAEESGGSYYLRYDQLSVDIYPENPLRIVIGALRKESRRLWNSIEKLNRMQESLTFGYENGRMTCTIYFPPEIGLPEIIAYCDGILKRYFDNNSTL